MRHCSIIGISDSREQWFEPDVTRIISSGTVFSGGTRHHDIMRRYLPESSTWIDITVPLSAVFTEYALHDDIVIFASGDPLFYGFASTVMRECPDCAIDVYPTFNSLQMLAHRMNLPYQEMRMVSLTGRPWDGLDEALISGEAMIGCLTDRHKTPNAVWARMCEYGYDNYVMTVGENLGNKEKERVAIFSPERQYEVPNCIILQKTYSRPRPFGIPEQEFNLLNGRTKMITKMPIRLLTLSALDLRSRRTLWDVGFCTGSVSIEAKLQFPHLSITAFEIREEAEELICMNSRRFGTPGIVPVIGNFLDQDLSLYPSPDAVFIGGHGGCLKEMIRKISEVLRPGGCIVFNSVSEQSRQMFEDGTAEAGRQITYCTRIQIDNHNPIYILKAQ